MNVSTDVRKVLTQFEEVTGKSPDINDIVVATSLCYTYFPKKIISDIKRCYNTDNPDSNNMSYYIKPVVSMGKARRNPANWSVWEIQQVEASFMAISHYVEQDYNYDALSMLKDICSVYLLDEIDASIKIAKESAVYSIPYLYRVLEGYRIEQDRLKSERMAFLQKQEESRKGLNKTVDIQRTPTDVASKVGNWMDLINTADLERRLNEHDDI